MDVPQSVIEACKRADSVAFEELIALTHKGVYSLALRLVGNPDDAADVTQETYLKLLRTIKQFRGDSKFSTWLYRVTSNVAVTSLRKRSRRERETSIDQSDWLQMPAAAVFQPESAAENNQLRERLDRALMSLPTGYRTVVVLKDMYGFSLEEIGKQAGITEGAAKVRLFRARQRLREMLSDDGASASGL